MTYIGVDTDDGALERAILRRIYAFGGEPYDLPAGIILEWRDGFYVCLNYTSQAQPAPIGRNIRPLIGEATMAPAGVTVWQE